MSAVGGDINEYKPVGNAFLVDEHQSLGFRLETQISQGQRLYLEDLLHKIYDLLHILKLWRIRIP